MSSLPKNLPLPLMSSQWSRQLNPVLANRIVQGLQLSNITLVASTPQVINTGLGKTQSGWFVTDINASAAVWRTQPFNDKTLTLEASANCIISLWVY